MLQASQVEGGDMRKEGTARLPRYKRGSRVVRRKVQRVRSLVTSPLYTHTRTSSLSCNLQHGLLQEAAICLRQYLVIVWLESEPT